MPQHPPGFRGTEEQRFWIKVKVNFDKYFNGTPCWEWQAAKSDLGYGRFMLQVEYTNADSVGVAAHRWAYEYCVGKIPDGLELDHLCRNPSCVNFSHLEPVTHRENMLRGNGFSSMHASKIVCSNGHNDWKIKPNGNRICRTCVRGYRQKRLKGELTHEEHVAKGFKGAASRRKNQPLMLGGVKISLSELSRRTGIHITTLLRRIRYGGMTVEQAVSISGKMKSGPKPKPKSNQPQPPAIAPVVRRRFSLGDD